MTAKPVEFMDDFKRTWMVFDRPFTTPTVPLHHPYSSRGGGTTCSTEGILSFMLGLCKEATVQIIVHVGVRFS